MYLRLGMFLALYGNGYVVQQGDSLVKLNIQALKRKLQVLAGALAIAAGSAIAGPVPVFDQTIDFSSQACVNYGDFQSCSAQYLNFIVYGDPSPSGQSPSYVVQSSQGLLTDAVLIFTASSGGDDTTGNGPNIDNAYVAVSSQVTNIYGTSIGAGEHDPPPASHIIDPTIVDVTGEVTGDICGGNGTCTPETTTAWDIGLQALIDALTIDGVRHDMLIFFDNNQLGATGQTELEAQAILGSALVCVHGDTLTDICFELVDENGTNMLSNGPGVFANNVDPTLFDTSLAYGDPLATNTADTTYPTGGPALANGTICVTNDPSHTAVAFNVQQCPAGTTLINNNLGSNKVEFILGIPELNAKLEEYLAQGYNRVSFEILFTNQNDGFEDVFILAGAPRTTVPEPGTMLLLGLGFLGLGLAVNRRRRLS